MREHHGRREADTNTADVGLALYVVALAVCGVIFLLVAGVADSRVGSGKSEKGRDQELENEDVKKSKSEDGEAMAIAIVTISIVLAVLGTIAITLSFASYRYYYDRALLVFLLSALGFTVLLVVAYLFGRSAKRYAERKGYPRYGFFSSWVLLPVPGMAHSALRPGQARALQPVRRRIRQGARGERGTRRNSDGRLSEWPRDAVSDGWKIASPEHQNDSQKRICDNGQEDNGRADNLSVTVAYTEEKRIRRRHVPHGGIAVCLSFLQATGRQRSSLPTS